MDSGYLKFISVLASGAVFVINFLLKFVVRAISMKERHETLTKMNISVALKLTVARFINSSIVLVLVNDYPKNWFKGGNLVYDANILLFMLAFQAPAMEIFYIPGIIKYFKKKAEIAKGPETQIT
jgi:hypothetical protein